MHFQHPLPSSIATSPRSYHSAHSLILVSPPSFTPRRTPHSSPSLSLSALLPQASHLRPHDPRYPFLHPDPSTPFHIPRKSKPSHGRHPECSHRRLSPPVPVVGGGPVLGRGREERDQPRGGWDGRRLASTGGGRTSGGIFRTSAVGEGIIGLRRAGGKGFPGGAGRRVLIELEAEMLRTVLRICLAVGVVGKGGDDS